MRVKTTDRGFRFAEFRDLYGQPCSIQESSLATQAAIWLGCDEGLHAEGRCMARMHLDRKLVKELIRRMQTWLDTGELK